MSNAPPSRTSAGFTFAVVAAAITGAALGLFGTGLSLIPWWLVGGVLAAIGAIGAAQRRRWGIVLLVLGGAMLLGVAAYFVLGILLPDGSPSGGGSR